ncbi:MAG: FtsH protease regulator HflK [Candidatus Methanofastidiosum methylothiophilum]|uniref:FtsH protease regulator HflK n=1 Tax=Candidatus Methanofastidiosum methylothiophilum TaxID=1705564 RepID=A0A150IXZ4_9EURY|nr:MAG: FtsH protease regulator HflK [Candidatus Methanofastidiosum methylthiophilus]KYC47138.1 MAG: FtsH protease regulator HflK [Candidatus Methanofastidiosum methylthiophilus]KYC49554.1 MAG: FtsH protease regulator HflK [Candidatus Methanofastidiosum methylthiophilus]
MMINPILLAPVAAILIFILAGIRVIKQYERAVKFRLGVFVGILGPGLKWIIPIVDRIEKVDLRVVTVDIPAQEVISKDNVPMKVNGVVFFKVTNADKAILEVEQYKFAISQLSQSALRDMAGKSDLDTILAKREEIGEKIRSIVDIETDPWGIKVTDVKIKDIELPDNMKRAMAHQAEAERDRRARIILAEAEEQAAQRLANAGDIIDKSPAALKLRLYQTLGEIATEKNSTIVFPFPEEMLEFLKEKKEKK